MATLAVGRCSAKVRSLGDLVVMRVRAIAGFVSDRIFRRRPQRRTGDGIFVAARIGGPQRSILLLRANCSGRQRRLLDDPSGIADLVLGDNVCVYANVVVANGEPDQWRSHFHGHQHVDVHPRHVVSLLLRPNQPSV